MTTLYQLGPTNSLLYSTDTLFGVESLASTPSPGSEFVENMAGGITVEGYRRTVWKFGFMAVTIYHRLLATVLSSAGTGTVDITTTTALEGGGTAFTTQLVVDADIWVAPTGGFDNIGIIYSITDADSAVMAAAWANTLNTQAFRYRLPTTYSSTCVVVTRSDVDNFRKWNAVIRMPNPKDLKRWGGDYEDVVLDFVLTSLNVS